MDNLCDRVERRDGSAVIRAGGVAVEEVLGRLSAGEAPEAVAGALGLGPTDLVAAVAFDAIGDGQGPPLVQGPARRPGLARTLSGDALAPLWPRARRPARLALAAGLLQLHDFWDASHQAAQQADDLGETAVSAYWHGIAHRREPDAGNAAYWFRRVGRHPLFPLLRQQAEPLLDAQPDPNLAARLDRGQAWDPFAMIDLCTTARPGSPTAGLARRLQCLEMNLLLGATLEKLE